MASLRVCVRDGWYFERMFRIFVTAGEDASLAGGNFDVSLNYELEKMCRVGAFRFFKFL